MNPLILAAAFALAELASGPPLPHQLVKDWAKLPKGWNFGECSGVAVDAKDNVWVFNRGPHGVIQFDRDGNMLQAWSEVPVVSAHGIKVDPDGNVWLVDVLGHQVIKATPEGRVLMRFGNNGAQPGDNNTPYAYNRPTAVAFEPNGTYFVSDGYVNSRVVRYSKDGEFQLQWGRKGTGEGEFDLVHDVALDAGGRVYVADRTNERVQIFDRDGHFLGQWRNVGAAWGLAYASRENAFYMADGKNNRVVKLNLDGQVLGVLGSFGKTPGKFDFVHHLAVDSTGAIYTVEIKNWRVQKFAPPR